MIKPTTPEWTIVILGRWNKAIFNPKWLADNILEDKNVVVEVDMQPGLPLRITGDKVLILPREDRLILGPTAITDEQLTRVEGIAVRVLELLEHTPVMRAGMNFGYETEDVDEAFIEEHFPEPDAGVFALNGLTARKRLCKWQARYGDEVLNMTYEIEAEKLRIKFNYDSETSDTGAAVARIKGKFLQHRDTTLQLLGRLYGLSTED